MGRGCKGEVAKGEEITMGIGCKEGDVAREGRLQGERLQRGRCCKEEKICKGEEVAR